MAKEQKAGTSPAPAKANGKRKVNNEDEVLIVLSSSSNSDNHITNNNNGENSDSSEEQLQQPQPQMEKQVSEEEDVVVDDSLEVEENNIEASKKTKKKKNEDENQKKKDKKRKEEIEEKESSSSSLYQIPMNRVSRIIRSEDPNVRISQEAVFIINKASEKFLQLFTTEAYASAFLDRKKHIDYKHLSSVISKRRRFDFLSDFVPEKVKAEDALKESSPPLET